MNHGHPTPPGAPAHNGRTHRVVGRFALYDVIASGGMATVHFGRMVGAVGFSKTVAIKRLHPHLAQNPEFVRMLVDEARLAARVQHPNVVATLDVVLADGEVLIVLDYVHGESMWHLLSASAKRGLRVPPSIVSAVVMNALHGLHAAHEACDEHGSPLGLVHRDVSPQNIMVGVDGIARVLDFGVAKATGRLQSTHDGQLKGKLAYMAPEQIQGRAIDRRTDVYATAAVLWGGLVGRRLVEGENEGEVIAKVVQGGFPPPSAFAPGISPQLDAIVMSGLAYQQEMRFPNARDMALALESVCAPASPFEVAEWVKTVGAEALALRSLRVREMESRSDVRVSHADASGSMKVEAGYDPTRSGVVVPGATRTYYASPAAPPYPSPASHPTTLPLPMSMPMTMPMPMAPPSHLTPPHLMAPSHPAPPSAIEPPPPSAHGARLVLTALISIVVTTSLVIAGYLYVTRPRARVEPPSVAVAPPSPPSIAVQDLPQAPVVTLPSPPPPPIAVQDPPSPSPSPPPAPAVAPPPSPPPPPVARPSGRGRGGKPKANCDSPFYVDADGIKQIRPECM